MTIRKSLLQEDTYFRVMRLLEASPDITQREMAGLLGLSLGGVNYCLKALMKKGWVKMKNFSQSKNKFGYVYLVTHAGLTAKASLANDFLKRKLQEYNELQLEINIMQAELLQLEIIRGIKDQKSTHQKSRNYDDIKTK